MNFFAHDGLVLVLLLACSRVRTLPILADRCNLRERIVCRATLIPSLIASDLLRFRSSGFALPFTQGSLRVTYIFWLWP